MRLDHRNGDTCECTFGVSARRPRLFATIAAFAILVLPPPSFAGTFTVFEHDYTRVDRKPVTETYSFDVLNPSTRYFITVHNGGLSGQWTKVSSATISLNGEPIIRTNEFNGEIELIEKSIIIAEQNELSVQLRSEVGSGLTIHVVGVDDDPPTITASVSPEPNQNGWHKDDVLISFECSDAISGIASCTEPVDVTVETAGERITGTAADNAGNISEVSVIVRLDKTAPVITRHWPPTHEFTTDRSGIDVEGRVVDSLSGVDFALLEATQGVQSLSEPDFAVVGDLDTNIPQGASWTDNTFALQSADLAGNSAQQDFLVRYTESVYALPTDPARTEVIQGLPTSVDRGIVLFESSVARSLIDQILAEEGGRVVGFLPVSNTAIVAFGTEQVDELVNALGSLQSRSEVLAAAPAIFFPNLSFDNNSLSAEQRASYDNILSAAAKQYIIDNGLPLSPVNIGIIETGMDDSHGQNNEFSNVIFYDLCTPEGQAGTPGVPVDVATARTNNHGTKITGIMAGANNGNGNNGVVRGVPGSQFGVHVFRMNCGGGNDWPLIATAFDLILGGTLGDFDVVNMSFGGIVSNLTTREEYRDIYASYFDSAAGRDILWVGGAGNDDQEIACNEFLPSGLACDLGQVVAVGAYNAEDLLRGQWVNSEGDLFGSNWGAGVTISAPGTGVWTATDPGTYGGVSGTSAATPLLAGAAAVIFAASPMEPATMKALLVDEAQALADGALPEGGLDVMASLQASLPKVVYNNGASTHTGGSAVGHFIAADDFVVSVAIRATGASVDVSDGPAGENRRWDGTVEWWLFEDNAGLPGNLLAEGAGSNIRARNVTVSPLGFRDFTVDFDFGEEILLAAGQRYWLALHMQSDFSRLSVFWDHQGSTVGHASRSGGELINDVPNFVDGEFAFPSAFDKAFRVWGRIGP